MPGWSRLPVINPGAVADNAQVTQAAGGD